MYYFLSPAPGGGARFWTYEVAFVIGDTTRGFTHSPCSLLSIFSSIGIRALETRWRQAESTGSSHQLPWNRVASHPLTRDPAHYNNSRALRRTRRSPPGDRGDSFSRPYRTSSSPSAPPSRSPVFSPALKMTSFPSDSQSRFAVARVVSGSQLRAAGGRMSSKRKKNTGRGQRIEQESGRTKDTNGQRGKGTRRIPRHQA